MKYASSNTFLKAKGFSLLEVLIASVVVAGTLLGSMKLQVESMRLSQSSRSDVIAMQMAQKLMDNISMSKKPNNYWNFTANGPASDAFLTNWRNELYSAIPNSNASVNCNNADSLCTIEIGWLTQSGIPRKSEYIVRSAIL